MLAFPSTYSVRITSLGYAPPRETPERLVGGDVCRWRGLGIRRQVHCDPGDRWRQPADEVNAQRLVMIAEQNVFEKSYQAAQSKSKSLPQELRCKDKALAEGVSQLTWQLGLAACALQQMAPKPLILDACNGNATRTATAPPSSESPIDAAASDS